MGGLPDWEVLNLNICIAGFGLTDEVHLNITKIFKVAVHNCKNVRKQLYTFGYVALRLQNATIP